MGGLYEEGGGKDSDGYVRGRGVATDAQVCTTQGVKKHSLTHTHMNIHTHTHTHTHSLEVLVLHQLRQCIHVLEKRHHLRGTHLLT
jgi:microcystin-dependent protein